MRALEAVWIAFWVALAVAMAVPKPAPAPAPKPVTPYCVDPFVSEEMDDVTYMPCSLVPYRWRA